MTLLQINRLFFIVILTGLFGCSLTPVREDYYNFVNTKNYSKIDSKNVHCKSGVCDAYIVMVSPRASSDYGSGIRAGESTEVTSRDRFFCKEHVMLTLMMTERSLDLQKVLYSGTFKEDDKNKQYIVPNSRASDWEAYVCKGQKGYQPLD